MWTVDDFSILSRGKDGGVDAFLIGRRLLGMDDYRSLVYYEKYTKKYVLL